MTDVPNLMAKSGRASLNKRQVGDLTCFKAGADLLHDGDVVGGDAVGDVLLAQVLHRLVHRLRVRAQRHLRLGKQEIHKYQEQAEMTRGAQRMGEKLEPRFGGKIAMKKQEGMPKIRGEKGRERSRQTEEQTMRERNR